MNKIFTLACLCFFVSANAQFLESKPPTDRELKINNANDVATLMRVAMIAKKEGKYDDLIKALEKVVKLKPSIPVFQYKLAQAYSLAGKKSEAYNALIALQKQGIYYDLANDPDLETIKVHNVFNYIKENMDISGQHYGEGVEAFNINKSFSGLLFESLTFDEKSQSFLMGSLRDGSVIKVESNGNISRLVEPTPGGKNGPWAALSLAADSKNNVLWVASAAISQFGKVDKETSGLSGIFKYELDTGKLISSILVPENKRPTFIRDMHLTPKGDLFFIDGIKNLVLKIGKDSNDITVAFATQKYQNLRSITSDETGDILYVSDNEEGIIILSLKDQQIFNFSNKPDLNLTGISDMLFDDNSLIILQNGFKPERIMRLKLNDSKFVINRIIPIEAANPQFNNLSYGAVVGEGLFFIANSQLPKTNLYGALLPGQEWEHMVVLSTNKHYKEAETIKFQEELEKQKQKVGGK